MYVLIFGNFHLYRSIMTILDPYLDKLHLLSQIFIPYPEFPYLSTLPHTGLYHYSGIKLVVIG
jgi:hypothetical protein